MDIASLKDDAAASEERWTRREGLRVYSDGSELEGGVGAAAVLLNKRTQEWMSLRLFLGPAEQHTVYEAEAWCWGRSWPRARAGVAVLHQSR